MKFGTKVLLTWKNNLDLPRKPWNPGRRSYLVNIEERLRLSYFVNTEERARTWQVGERDVANERLAHFLVIPMLPASHTHCSRKYQASGHCIFSSLRHEGPLYCIWVDVCLWPPGKSQKAKGHLEIKCRSYPLTHNEGELALTTRHQGGTIMDVVNLSSLRRILCPTRCW